MEVVCKICKKKIDRDSAYKVTINGKNYYFCNEIEYTEKQKEIQKNKYIVDNLVEILGAKESQISLIKSEISKMVDIFNLNLLYFFMRENKENLKNNMKNKIDKSGEFETFYNKTRYCFAIIKSDLGKKQLHVDPKKDYKEEIRKNVEVDVSLTTNMPRINQIKRRRGMDQIEEEYDGNK